MAGQLEIIEDGYNGFLWRLRRAKREDDESNRRWNIAERIIKNDDYEREI